jgi:hypothetical protein
MHDRKETIKRHLTSTRQETVAALNALTPDQWETTVYSDDATWRVSDLFGHLLYAEQGMTRLIEGIRAGASGVPEDFDLDRWNARGFQMYQDRTRAELLTALDSSRRLLLELVDSLQDDDWSKEGRHGSLRVMTIAEILHVIAYHERQHVKDISQVLSR